MLLTAFILHRELSILKLFIPAILFFLPVGVVYLVFVFADCHSSFLKNKMQFFYYG